MKQIKTSLLFELIDYTLKNHPVDNLPNKLYVQGLNDLKIFLESSCTAWDVKRFLNKKGLEK